MHIAEFISPERIVVRSQAGSKKRALELVSGLIASSQPGMAETQVFDCLVARERLGSTGIGHGIAIPHGRLKAVARPVGAFAALQKGVDFDALDGMPVDMVCAVVVPAESTEDHLQILASLAERFSDENLRERLRRAGSEAELYSLLTGEIVAPLRQVSTPG